VRLILIGGDKLVYFLARQFIQEHAHVTIICRNPTRSKDMAHHLKATIVNGDGSDIKMLEVAGARRADVLLALTPYDADNLVACQLARSVYEVPRVMAMVNDPDNEQVFNALGISDVFSVTRVLVTMIEQQTSFDDITNLMPLAQGRINITDVHLDDCSPALGKPLADLKLSEDTVVAAIIRNQKLVVPRGSTRLQEHDHLVLISQPDKQKDDIELLCGTHN
jgi:trk system potassium uptake protein